LAPRDLVIIGQPKSGKGAILRRFYKKKKYTYLDLEKVDRYIEARRFVYILHNKLLNGRSSQNFIKIRKNVVIKEMQII
jgi:hypothetical protein